MEDTQANELMDRAEAVYRLDGGNGQYWVLVTKVGGGTISREYEGDWLVSFLDAEDGALLYSGIICIGIPKAHNQVASIALQVYEYEFMEEL